MPHSPLEVIMIMLALPVGPTLAVLVAFIVVIRFSLKKLIGI